MAVTGSWNVAVLSLLEACAIFVVKKTIVTKECNIVEILTQIHIRSWERYSYWCWIFDINSLVLDQLYTLRRSFTIELRFSVGIICVISIAERRLCRSGLS